MLDHLINPDAPTKMENAINYHWDELNRTGETTFKSAEEDRTISMDKITEYCLGDFGQLGLHAQTLQGLPFVSTLREMIKKRRNYLMDEALGDFYGL